MSSALDLDGSSKGTVLNGPCDWKQWISIVKKFATSHNLWEFLDPAVQEGKPVLQQPVEPTFRLINDKVSDLVDLTSEEFRRLEFLHTQYRSKLQGYRDQVKALASLQQHIVKTIGNYYSTIAEEHDVAKQLTLLQARVAPTDWALEREVLQRYRSTLQSPNRTKIEAWVTQWQKVLTEAKQLGLPDVQDLRPTQDFLQAVSSINTPFTDYWVNKMEDEAALGKPNWKTVFPDGIKISEIFERAHRIKAAKNNKGSFGAAFQGKGEKTEKKEDKPKWSSRKNDKGIPLCVCGKHHFFADCFYLIESARPDGWTADQTVEKKIKDILDSNPWAKTMTERAQQSKQKEKEKASDSSNGSSVKGTAFAGLPPTPEHTPPPSTSFSAGKAVYPLRDSFILDSGSDTHICNDRSRFLDYSSLAEPEDLFAGDSQLQILGNGTVRMKLEEGGLFQLNEVAYVPNFHTNIASLDRFLAKGYNWNPASGLVSKDDQIVFHTRRLFRQPVIEYNQLSEVAPSSNFTSSSAPRPAQIADATLWHKRLGHLNAQALEHLVENTTGCKIKGPVTVDCESCSLGKGKRVVSRRSPQNKAQRPFWRIYIDIFSLHTSFNDKEAVLLIKDEFTSMIFIHFLNDATQDSVMTALRNHEAMIKRQWDLNICIIHRDNDRALQTAYEAWVEERGIQDEPTAPYTSAQNGSAERSGGVIGTQARTMGIDAKLPSDLWPETWKAAVFLHNRSPMQNHGFKTPFQLLHQWLQDNNKDTGYQQTQPDITFLKAYGCRAYPLNKQALQNKQKKDLKTDPHAEIGYLVGYDSTNIFRIWIPSTSEVRRVRDVTFNESLFYDGIDKPPEPIPQRIEVRLPGHIEDESEYEEVATLRKTGLRFKFYPNHLITRNQMTRMNFTTLRIPIQRRI
ncbi:integrase core domain-containing protein [Hirsutella rhossiliensis]|uniref:Integrase core domain-containing protein n=1 Tax=Hirsutella rhossiliensis TaxID=111463 RepID=A0A9P8SPD2_9HYPO|nr:integrase core domain-containing protein [Hirsutella rhossiliensis]KAH0968810.1 integrase core domain-containing protein [Hirsutella rhossiliensis]